MVAKNFFSLVSAMPCAEMFGACSFMLAFARFLEVFFERSSGGLWGYEKETPFSRAEISCSGNPGSISRKFANPLQSSRDFFLCGNSRLLSNSRANFFGSRKGAKARRCSVLVCWYVGSVLVSHQHTQSDTQQRVKASMLVCWCIPPSRLNCTCALAAAAV